MSGVVGESLEQALARLARADRLLLALDFDGTLSPLVNHADSARMVPTAAAALRRLSAAPGVSVALVSGRPIDGLRRVAAMPPRVLLAGSHGAELAGPGGAFAAPAAGERARVEALLAELHAELGAVPGVRVEAKPYGAGVHWRLTPGPLRPGVRATAVAVARRHPGLTARNGKDLVEFSVRSATKGDALRALRRAVRADAVLFAGDDVTDEDGFAALGPADVGIKVGPGRSRARFRVDGIGSLARLLSRFGR